jgi:lysophospholipase L1-like esterase
MRKFILALALLIGAAVAALVGQQVFVEGSLGPAAMAVSAVLISVDVAMWATYLLLPTRHRAVVLNLWLAFFSVAITYVVLDLAAGWILIRPLSPPLVPDQTRHHKLVPNSYSEFNQKDFSYVQRVNSHGMRGVDVTTEKPAGTYRILMLGDSFTMGKGVEDDETFSVQLQKALNEGGRTCGRRIEVLNGGVDSYAPILSFIELKELQALKPDMVVENLDVSDLVQETAYRQQAVRGSNGEIVAVPQLGDPDSLVDKVRNWTEKHLFLTRVALFYATRTFNYREITVRDVVTHADAAVVAHTLEGDVDRTAQWEAIFESLQQMHKYAESQGIRFLLTTYPWPHQLNDTDWVPGRWAFMPKDAKPSNNSNQTIHAMSTSMGIPLLDVTADFRAYAGGARLFFDLDMHWTPAGHQVIAKALENYIVANVARQWCGA